MADSPPRPSLLHVPNPALEWAGLGPAFGVALAALVLAVVVEVWLGGRVLSHPVLAGALVVLSPLVAGFAPAYLHRRRRRILELRRTDTEVLGAPGGPLPLGEGRITVSWETVVGPDVYAMPYATSAYVVRYTGSGGDREILNNGLDPARVRTFAEALCRLGGWGMTFTDETADEDRTAADFDQPLVARLAAGHVDLGRPLRPDHPVAVQEAGDGATVIRDGVHPLPLDLLYALPLVLAAVMVFFVTPGPVSRAVHLTVFGAILFLPLLVDRGLRQTLEVRPAGVHLRTRIFGLLVRNDFVPTQGLESLYVMRDGLSHALVLAGRGTYVVGARYHELAQAGEARRRLIDALRGGHPAPPPK